MAEDGEIDWKEPARQITKGALSGLWDWIKGWRGTAAEPTKVARSVLIIGAGGVGKSTLARLLSAQVDWLDESVGTYEESSDLERFVLTDDVDVEIVVAPGQAYRREADWPGLHAQIANGAFRGIILMNAYGHHSFSTPSYKNHALWPSTGTKDSFRTAFFADRRADELRILKQLVPFVSVCKQRLWFLSVVSKQDLWAAQQGAVEEHYRSGEYAGTVREMTAALGTHTFRHDFAFVSLVLRNLETQAGEKLQTTASNGYDMSRLAASIRRLVDTFESIRAWEEGQ